MPLISCIMPTRNRRHLIGLALRSFYAQDWAEKELIVVDDGEDCVKDVFEGLPEVAYIRVGKKLRIGEKRNLGCLAARGEVLVNWDDDDWSAPERIVEQVGALQASASDVIGYHSLLFWDQNKHEASFWDGIRGYGPGSTLCYRREYWQEHKYPNASIGEDGIFVKPAQILRKMLTLDGGQQMVARIHGANTAARNPIPGVVVERSYIPFMFFEDLRHCSLAA